MQQMISKWYPEDDPIIRDQAEILENLLDGTLSQLAKEGFLIVCSRFVDKFGNHRTQELAKTFRTDTLEGRAALLISLEYVTKWVGGMETYLRRYPVTIIPPKPAYPQFKIIGIENIATKLYRVLDSGSTANRTTTELTINYIQRTGRLPAKPKQKRPVRRAKPNFHWCTYEKWNDPESTREALQILPEWSDCQLRAAILTSNVKKSAYVAFNGDMYDPNNDILHFDNYYYEPLAQDHPPFQGGGTQIAIEGEPLVETLEQWNRSLMTWKVIWSRASYAG